MANKSKIIFLLYFIAVILFVTGSVLHFYYGPVYLRWALIGAVIIFLGIALFFFLIALSVIFKLRKGVKKKKI